jgi:hypothetical protein
VKLDEFLMQGLIDSLNNGLIAPELITVYAGNYLAKSLITQDDMTKIQTAVTAYQTAQATAANSDSTSESTSASESVPTSNSDSDSKSTSTSESTSESASATTATSETATN